MSACQHVWFIGDQFHQRCIGLFVRSLGQPCTLQFLPALQIITMPENTRPGELVARLQITGSAAEISTRLIYNSSDVKTNGTDYFTLNFTDLLLRSSEFYRRFSPPWGKRHWNAWLCLALDYDWWTSNGYPNPFRFIVECTVLADQSVHDIDFQLDLIDVNDNPPRFSQSIYQIDVIETTPVNSIVSSAIYAHDTDSGVFGAFSYYLLDNSSAYSVSRSSRRRSRGERASCFSPTFVWSIRTMPVSFSFIRWITIWWSRISIWQSLPKSVFVVVDSFFWHWFLSLGQRKSTSFLSSHSFHPHHRRGQLWSEISFLLLSPEHLHRHARGFGSRSERRQNLRLRPRFRY